MITFLNLVARSNIILALNSSITILGQAGRKIAPNTGANATKFFTLATKS